METTQTILIVLLSVGFFILLILAIALTVILIKILNNVRRLTQRVDETTENMGELVRYAGRKLAPAAISTLASLMMRRAKSKLSRDK